MRISKIRSFLYFFAKILGDIQALTSHRKNAIPKRIARRIAGKIAGNFLGKLIK